MNTLAVVAGIVLVISFIGMSMCIVSKMLDFIFDIVQTILYPSDPNDEYYQAVADKLNESGLSDEVNNFWELQMYVYSVASTKSVFAGLY